MKLLETIKIFKDEFLETMSKFMEVHIMAVRKKKQEKEAEGDK